MDYIGLFFVTGVVSLMAAHLIETLSGLRAKYRVMGRNLIAPPALQASASIRMRSAYASMRLRKRRRLRPAYRHRIDPSQRLPGVGRN
jgi:hypothetical protein